MPLDCVYLFYKKKVGGKEKGICDKSLDLVGKMNVTSSLTLYADSDNSEVMETQWVLFGADAKKFGNFACSDYILGKTKVSVNKMVDMFRPKHLPKHKSCSQFGIESYVREHISWEADTSSNVGRLGAKIFQAGPPNVELAAIVLREEAHDSHQETVVGGWGLKFLQKARVRCANTSQVAPVSSEPSQKSRLRDMGDCSTSMNVIIPAGAHGGPGTRNGGPSSLTERWRSGGHCDWRLGYWLPSYSSHQPTKQRNMD
ncbi:hypothetical protein IFM89_014663 [Coptis chinensis]|uniref:Uncharacterized protein n=1 Tax=Coptis chinensis TaxID=261450 RepID=A0A835HMG1_9MAGN|nr:hypothetical protein IFM89_014663 [Coptis chinensis]